MKKQQRHGKYDPDEVRYITADGKPVRADDEWFAEVVRDWEHAGVPSEVVHMARPLLDGNARQQSVAETFLNNVIERLMDSQEAQQALLPVLAREGVGMGRVPHISQSDFDSAWDEFSGPAQRSTGDISFGHSEATGRQRLSGANPDA